LRRFYMKRALLVAALFFFAFVFVGHALAQEGAGGAEWSKQAFMNQMSQAKVQNFTGTVLSHDPACHCVVVKTPRGELTLQDDYAKFMQEYDQAKGLKVGAKVKGTYKTVNYIHYLQAVSYEGM
jgi:hypothetical protein